MALFFKTEYFGISRAMTCFYLLYIVIHLPMIFITYERLCLKLVKRSNYNLLHRLIIRPTMFKATIQYFVKSKMISSA